MQRGTRLIVLAVLALVAPTLVDGVASSITAGS
jgi:hypothetical protein